MGENAVTSVTAVVNQVKMQMMMLILELSDTIANWTAPIVEIRCNKKEFLTKV